MVWLYPAALAGLLAVAGPIAVHMLRRRQARRILVPSVRFVPGADESAVRFRSVSDLALLGVRAAIIACAALALAQPLFLIESRTAAWADRTARVVIADTSDSARGAVTRDAIAAESLSADPAVAIETTEIGPSLDRATAWLATAPPARREIVVLSDFQRGSLTDEAVSRVPRAIGLRLVRLPDAGDWQREAPVVELLAENGVLEGRVRLDDQATAVSYAARPARMDGLRVLARPSDANAVASLLRVVAAAGARAPSAAQPIVIRFAGAGRGASPPAPGGEWTFGAAQRLLRSPLVSGIPIEISTSGGSLVVDIDADPSSLAAAQVVKAALDARPDPRELTEHETGRLSDATLAGWSRPAGPPDPAAWRQSDDFDGRWLWAAALLLLGIEALVRRSVARDGRTVRAHAA